MIVIREYEVFPEYALTEEEMKGLSGHAQRELRATKLEKSGRLNPCTLPTNGAHKDHKCGKESGIVQCMHPMVARKIIQLVREGTTNESSESQTDTERVCTIGIQRKLSQ